MYRMFHKTVHKHHHCWQKQQVLFMHGKRSIGCDNGSGDFPIKAWPRACPGR